MSVSSELDARMEMRAFIDRARAHYNEWYVGVAADPERRLEAHGVEENDWFIVRRLPSAEAAQRVAESLLKLECDGSATPIAIEGEAEQVGEPAAVYAYWKRGHTTP